METTLLKLAPADDSDDESLFLFSLLILDNELDGEIIRCTNIVIKMEIMWGWLSCDYHVILRHQRLISLWTSSFNKQYRQATMHP
jgi:hypothetical protein